MGRSGKAEQGKGNIFQQLKSTALGGKNYSEGRKTNIRMWGHTTGWLGPTCHVEAIGDMVHPFS